MAPFMIVFVAFQLSVLCSAVMNAMLRTVALIVLGGLLLGCETSPRPEPGADFTRDVQGRYEIQLDATYRTCRRGPCHFPSLIPRTFKPTHWIYTRAIDGEIPAAQAIVTHEQGKTEY